MKKLFTILLFIAFFGSVSFADDVRVKLEPREPVINSSFELIFKIESSGNEEPYITFDSRGATVLGRKNTGVSTSSTFYNGRLTTKREITYVYELEAEVPGPMRISNIRVVLGDKTLRAHDISTKILRESRKPKEIFVMAAPSKTSVFLGEGIDVVYYIYRRVGMGNFIVESYPKLNKFIKRFHMLRSNREEVVEFQGMSYRRRPVYSARVYPEKLGKAYIDPLKMKVDYAVSRMGTGIFGFGLRQMRQKSIRSKKIEIQVKPIPTEGVPTHFTGLVGAHEFRITNTKSKHLVNEAIEIKLVVEGEGALENLDSPIIYEHQDMEQFDTKAELSEMGINKARKVFDYTYLARAPFQVASREMSFSYFDPNTEAFIEKVVKLPALIVGGTAPAAKSSGNLQTEKKTGDQTPKARVRKRRGLLAPLFYPAKIWEVSRSNWVKFLNITLGLGILLVLIWLGIVTIRGAGISDQLSVLCDEMQAQGINYSRLHKLLYLLADGDQQNELSLAKIVEKSQLPGDTKMYFEHLVDESELGTFKRPDQASKLEYKNKHFQALTNYIRKQNENHTELKRT